MWRGGVWGGYFPKFCFQENLGIFFLQTEEVAILFEWLAYNAPQSYFYWNLAHFIFQPLWIIIDLFEWQLSKIILFFKFLFLIQFLEKTW